MTLPPSGELLLRYRPAAVSARALCKALSDAPCLSGTARCVRLLGGEMPYSDISRNDDKETATPIFQGRGAWGVAPVEFSLRQSP